MSPAGKRSFSLPSTNPGGSILDELTGAPPAPPAATPPTTTPEVPASTPRAEPHPAAAPEPTAGRRVPIRVQIPEPLADRVRGAVAALAYRADSWTSLNAATAAALEAFVSQAEAEHNGGQPFPWRPGRQLQPGRRVGH